MKFKALLMFLEKYNREAETSLLVFIAQEVDSIADIVGYDF
jgi:hypothetical protein